MWRRNEAYQVQLFASDARDGHPSRRQQFYSDRVTSDSGNQSTTFAMGDKSYVVGTFTADATTQSIYIHDGGVGDTRYLNAISLTTEPKGD